MLHVALQNSWPKQPDMPDSGPAERAVLLIGTLQGLPLYLGPYGILGMRE